LLREATKQKAVLMNKTAIESTIIRSVRANLARAEKNNTDIPRPAVTLAFAQSLDGCISVSQGTATAISNDQSMLMTHQLRAMHNAILVGINTVLVDDPRLTVRHTCGENPIPVVLDSRLRTPPTARLLHQSRPPAIIATLPDASREREQELVKAGARVIRIPEAPGGGLQLSELFLWLRQQQVNSLMIEGGAKVISSVLADCLVDQLVLTIAPKFFGRNGVRAVETLNCVHSIDDPCLTDVEVEQRGDDLVVRGNLATDDSAIWTGNDTLPVRRSDVR
jgi:3,4-dihydroxy 2-butanone 4-phosphate synthase/GTP cyclohydrolase II